MARKTRRGWPGREQGYALTIRGRESAAYFRVSDNPDVEQASVGQQRDEWELWTPRAGVTPGPAYADDDRSASRYSTKIREEFARLRADIAAGRLDGCVLWFWSTSRQTRGDIALDVLATESEAHGIVWCTGGQVLNPANGDDMLIAGIHNIIDKAYSDRLSKDVTRAKRDGAHAGRPAAVPLYGYRRVYKTDEHGQPVMVKGRPVIVGDEPDSLDENGVAVPGTPAAIVREIFSRIETGDTLSAIRASLEDRRVPSARHPRKCTTCGYKLGKDHACIHGHAQDLCQWWASAVRFIATNPGYIGQRVYQAESANVRDRRRAVLDGVTTMWPALVTEDQFWTVQNILADGGRIRWRGPGPGGNPGGKVRRQYLLSGVARCGSCGAAMGGHFEQGRDWYKCRQRGCSTIRADWLDAYAEDRLVSWLVLPEVRTQIWGGREEDNAARTAARVTLAKLNADLEEATQLYEAGEISGKAFARKEKALEAKIEETQAKAHPDAPPRLLDMLGPDAADRWVALRTANPSAARQLMAMVTTIYVKPAGRRGGVVTALDETRCDWRWNIGPDASTPPALTGCTESLAARKAALSAARDHAAAMLTADPSLADATVGRAAGCAYGTVKRVRDRLTADGTITDPGYRTGADGKAYRTTGNGHPGSPRKSVVTAP